MNRRPLEELLGGTGFLVASTVVHAAVFALLLLAHPKESDRRHRPIFVELQRQPPLEPLPTPPPITPPTEPAPDERPPSVRRPARPPERAAPPRRPDDDRLREPPSGPPVEPIPPAPAPSEPERRDERPRVNLFSTSAITAALPSMNGVSVPHDPNGTTRRAGDGRLPPGVRDPSADREEAAGRIRQFFDQAQNDQRLAAGRVAPRWRAAERDLSNTFSPPTGTVSDDGAVGGFLKQWLATRPSGGTVPRGVDPSTEAGFLGSMGPGGGGSGRTDPMQQFRVRAEVEVTIGADGKVQSAKVVMRSGRRKFDEAALQAVKQAVEKDGALDDGQAVLTRWSVEAWLQVAGPTAIGFTFDESLGKASGNYPMKKSVKTRVALLSVTPRN